MSVKTFEIVEKLKSLNLIETVELVKQIEETFNVDTSRVQVNLPFLFKPILDDNKIEIQQIEFELILEEFPSNKKIAILKVVREITGLGLKEAKDFVESVPQTVKTGIAIDEAEAVKEKLEAVGAKVSLK